MNDSAKLTRCGNYPPKPSAGSTRLTANGLIAAALACLLILGVGTIAYRTGLEAGAYDAQHESWNAGYVAGKETCQ